MRLLLPPPLALLLRERLNIDIGELNESLIVEPEREVLDKLGDFSYHFIGRGGSFQFGSGDKPRPLSPLELGWRVCLNRPRGYCEPLSR